ncbi:radical SAM/SPASM domain-containing protein [Actinomycetota bacterium]
MEKINYAVTINESITDGIKKIFGILKSSSFLSYFFYFCHSIYWQKKAMRLRGYWYKEGIKVPPLMIASITERCNLKCKGCYAQIHKKKRDSEISKEHWLNIFNEARSLGISFIILAGGEPFLKPEILEHTKSFPEIIFLVFTNGQLIDQEQINRLKKQKNLIPVISIEGSEKETDSRRGKGVYKEIKRVIEDLNKNNIYFGTSATVTIKNFNTLTDKDYIKDLVDHECKLFFFLEYIPTEKYTEYLVIDNTQRKKLLSLMASFESKYPGIFITFPGNEDKFGGCLSAGRGFVHVSPGGDLEPCPVAPYSDKNLKSISLKDALSSDLLRQIREDTEYRSDTSKGCVLWNNRHWVESLLEYEV